MLSVIVVSLASLATLAGSIREAAAMPRQMDRPWMTQLRVPPLKGVPFTDQEATIIRAYFAAHPAAPDPVSTHDAQRIVRAKRLPADVPRRPIPEELALKLQPRDGVEVLMVGRDVVLLSSYRQLVVDVLRGVL